MECCSHLVIALMTAGETWARQPEGDVCHYFVGASLSASQCTIANARSSFEPNVEPRKCQRYYKLVDIMRAWGCPSAIQLALAVFNNRPTNALRTTQVDMLSAVWGRRFFLCYRQQELYGTRGLRVTNFWPWKDSSTYLPSHIFVTSVKVLFFACIILSPLCYILDSHNTEVHWCHQFAESCQSLWNLSAFRTSKEKSSSYSFYAAPDPNYASVENGNVRNCVAYISNRYCARIKSTQLPIKRIFWGSGEIRRVTGLGLLCHWFEMDFSNRGSRIVLFTRLWNAINDVTAKLQYGKWW